MSKVLLIINPVAGKMRSKTGLFTISQVFCDAGWDVCVKITKERGDATAFAQRAADDGFDVVACAGGDGTLNEVITGVMRSDNSIDIGYIPSGSTNDFATSMKISSNIKKAAENIVAHEPVLIDAGKFNDRYFSYIASFGAFTAASYSAPQASKNVFGHLAYVAEGLKTLPSIKPYHIRLTVDGRSFEDDYVFGSISNSTTVGGLVKLSDAIVDMSDGQFEIILVRNPQNAIDLNSLVNAITGSDYENCDLVDFVHGSNIVIEFNEPIAWSLDGEYEEGGSRVVIDNIHHAYSIRK